MTIWKVCLKQERDPSKQDLPGANRDENSQKDGHFATKITSQRVAIGWGVVRTNQGPSGFMTSRLNSWVVTHIHESIGAPGILNIVCSIYQTCWFGRCIFDFNYGIILGIYGEFQGGKNDHTLSPRNTSPWLAGSPFHPTLLNSNVNRPSEKRVFFCETWTNPSEAVEWSKNDSRTLPDLGN